MMRGRIVKAGAVNSLWMALYLVALGAAAHASPLGDDEIQAAVDKIAEEAMKTGRLASLSIAIERDGKTLLAKGYGFADLENEVPATDKTIYRIGSITKQYTSAAIMQLVEQGKIGLGDPLTKFIPDYPDTEHTVTIHQLLNHTSGIQSYTSMPWFRTQRRLDHTTDEMIQVFGALPFNFEPGEKFLYNNSGYFLLGVIVEKVSGQTYAEYLREHLWDPHGLDSSHYLYVKPIIKNRARGYEYRSGALENAEPLSMLNPYSAGSLGANALDLLDWNRALAGGEVVSEASYELMTTPADLNNGEPIRYGYGLFVDELEGRRRVQHGGGIDGFRSQLSHYPDDGLTIAVLANSGAAQPGRIESDIARAILGIAPPEPIKPVEISRTDLKRYSGRFRLGESTLSTWALAGKLMTRVGPGSAAGAVYIGDDTFAAGDSPRTLFVFEMKKGQAVSCTVRGGGQERTAPRITDQAITNRPITR